MAVWETTGCVQAEIASKVIHLGDSRIDRSVSWEHWPSVGKARDLKLTDLKGIAQLGLQVRNFPSS